jgi:hypothetical protein
VLLVGVHFPKSGISDSCWVSPHMAELARPPHSPVQKGRPLPESRIKNKGSIRCIMLQSKSGHGAAEFGQTADKKALSTRSENAILDYHARTL